MRKNIKFLICALLCSMVLFGGFNGLKTIPSQVEASESDWVTYLAEPSDYAYSFAIVGDTQYVTKYNPDALLSMYDWIAKNAESKKMKQVIGVGDITHTDAGMEWAYAYESINKLSGVVPYTVVRGNHDIRTSYYDYYFGRPGAPYEKECVAFFNEDSNTRARNTAHEFSVDNVNYLIIGLDFGAKDDVLQWANSVVESYPSHTVIVTTHAYLSKNGTLLNGDSDSPTSYDETLNNADDMWNKFIKKHKNISLVLSGHVFNENIVKRTDVGDNGNVVTSLMVNPQYYEYNKNNKYDPDRLTGMVAICYCSADGKAVDVQWYSTIKNKYFRPSVNAFSFNMHTVDKGEDYVSIRTVGNGKAQIVGSQNSTYKTLGDGEQVTVNFTPDKYYDLKKVTLDGVDITNQLENYVYTFTKSKNYHHIVVTYNDQTRYVLLEVNDISKGKINYDAKVPDATHRAGENICFTITPENGYEVEKVTFNSQEIFASDNSKYNVIIESKQNLLEVTYKAVQKSVSNTNANKIEQNQTQNKVRLNTANNNYSNNYLVVLAIIFAVLGACLLVVFVANKLIGKRR